MEHWFNLIPLLLLAAGGVALLAFDDLLISLGGLAATYLGAFFLLVQIEPIGLALVKLVTGLMAVGLIFVSRQNVPEIPRESSLASRIFRITALALVWLVIFLSAGSFRQIFPLNYETLAGSLITVSAALLVLGTSGNGLRITLGILAIYASFDILYSSLESSILINGLLSLIVMLIALIGVYISTRHESEYEE